MASGRTMTSILDPNMPVMVLPDTIWSFQVLNRVPVDPNMPIMVLPDAIWSFQVLNRVLYLWHVINWCCCHLCVLSLTRQIRIISSVCAWYDDQKCCRSLLHQNQPDYFWKVCDWVAHVMQCCFSVSVKPYIIFWKQTKTADHTDGWINKRVQHHFQFGKA